MSFSPIPLEEEFRLTNVAKLSECFLTPALEYSKFVRLQCLNKAEFQNLMLCLHKNEAWGGVVVKALRY